MVFIERLNPMYTTVILQVNHWKMSTFYFPAVYACLQQAGQGFAGKQTGL